MNFLFSNELPSLCKSFTYFFLTSFDHSFFFFVQTVKYKTRKNSASAQMRGRRLVSIGRTPIAATSDRHAIADPRTSPQLELPTYNQAMKGTGAAGLQPSDSGARRRAQSASVATSLPVYSNRIPSTSGASGVSTSSGKSTELSSMTTTTDSGATSDESRKPSERKGEGTGNPQVMSPSGTSETGHSSAPMMPSVSIIRAEQNMARAEEQIRSSQNSTTITDDSSDTCTESEVKSAQPEEGSKTSESSEREFARHVRGTSTPMNTSPAHSPNQSRPFNGHNISNGEANSRVETSETLEDNSSVEERKLRREEAIDDSST